MIDYSEYFTISVIRIIRIFQFHTDFGKYSTRTELSIRCNPNLRQYPLFSGHLTTSAIAIIIILNNIIGMSNTVDFCTKENCKSSLLFVIILQFYFSARLCEWSQWKSLKIVYLSSKVRPDNNDFMMLWSIKRKYLLFWRHKIVSDNNLYKLIFALANEFTMSKYIL